jgi:CcmD family protein
MKAKVYATIALIFFSVGAFAQASNERTGMADVMRSNGKIYVVTAVIFIIFLGIILYLVRLDRKMRRLEKEDFNNR